MTTRTQQKTDGSRKSRQRYPERARARNRVARAIRSGLLTRPDRCGKCGTPCYPDASHFDYAEPLRVEWLCRPCHVIKDLSEVCPNGHKYTPETTGTSCRGHRMCLICRRGVKRRYRAKARTS